MILVTVGMHDQGFDRLVRAADELAAQIEEQVFIQYGETQIISHDMRNVPNGLQVRRWSS
jgi:UDP-N-acetylglucosamine transferase subunit ALG13